ncbi:MAG: aspartate--tRNA(Asn) ligase [Clostridiales bacterium]|nr:aspartate--tRNA(Asn) ligase [Clostridiales bacterium]
MELIESAKEYQDQLEYLKGNIGKPAEVNGYVHRVRDFGDVVFIILRLDRGLLQCISSDSVTGAELQNLKDGMCLRVSGVVHTEERAENGFELIIDKYEILAKPAAQLPVPLGKKYMGLSLDTDLPLRQITLRHPIKRAVFKIQAEIANAFGSHLTSQGFTKIHTPKIVSAGAEGGADIFKVDYFGMPAYLSQSPQMYKQYMAGVFGRVYEIGSVYRAERHNTSRHLNEYIGLDLEMAFINGMNDVMQVQTGALKAMVESVKKNCEPELQLLNAKLPTIDKIPSVRFFEAKEIITQITGKPPKNKFDLDPIEEQQLCEWAEKTRGSEFIYVTHYPSKKRPFYAKDDPENPELALSFDLLFRGLEVTTGGQRINDYDEQVQKMNARKMDISLFDSYLTMHKYGMAPHGGLGMGLERLTMRLLNLQNVREASLFPRDMSRLVP